MFDFKDDDRFLARWLNDELSDEELKAFEASDDYPIYKKIKDGSEAYIRPDFINPDLLEQIKRDPKELSIGKKTTSPWYYGIAAAIVLLIGVFTIYKISDVTVAPGFGNQASIELPDGSIMVVNAKSTASYNKLSWNFSRTVELNGEAYFKVTPGDKFVVSTDAGNIQVLGTEFNVYSNDSFFEVTCYEGKVQITTESNENTLVAGTAYREYEEKSELIALSDVQPSWINNQSTFKSVPIKYVLNALENQYGITFKGNLPADELVFSGSFPHNNKELALKLVFGSLQIDFKFEGEKTVVLEN